MYLELFLTFLKIGAVSFGGGYGMIALIKETVINNGWLTNDEFLNFLGVAEATPGPLAVNMATFVGGETLGLPGAALATLGVVIPSFIIILIISVNLNKMLENKLISTCLNKLTPTIIALILSTGLILFLNTIFNFSSISSAFTFDLFGLLIFLIIACFTFIYYKIFKKVPSFIFLILLSGALGIIFYR